MKNRPNARLLCLLGVFAWPGLFRTLHGPSALSGVGAASAWTAARRLAVSISETTASARRCPFLRPVDAT
jgi:hypothetical protein